MKDVDINNLASVIVISYSNIKYLKENINSILKQNYSPIEIIISDDCSNEFDEEFKKSLELYIEENKKENIINYIVNKNKINEGGVKNLNKAIRLSKGKYIIPLECDDCFYDSESVKNIVDFFKYNSQYLMAKSYEYSCDVNMNPISKERFPQWCIDLLNGDPLDLYLRLCKGNFISGSHLYYTREFIDKFGMYDEDYKQLADHTKLLNITRQGCKIGIIDAITIYRRWGGESRDFNGYNLDQEKKIQIKNELNKDRKTMREKEIIPYIDKIKSGRP
ncbi:putative glycosyl transferase [uncultured Clostridium sp.]|nr:putative glycosyl transferase [uncultured Clostridium sp.]